ncbi:hypothetical protein HPB48_008236 [Haemaphysalis longicornis]|uniref:Uncharacterized protein n=1 Tax=Haemaphysalis longicornis TaxID=44386 RepID=A0A9J6GR32_HAELO|nr:hypothetical protein HPB48_008236 [Haemaphysalis longicornis]
MQPHAVCRRRRGSSGDPYERFPKNVQSGPTENDIMGSALNSPWPCDIPFGAAEMESVVQPGYEVRRVSRDTYYAVVMEDCMPRRSASTDNYTKPTTTWNYPKRQLHKASTAIREMMSRSRELSSGLVTLNTVTAQPRVPGDTARPESQIKTESGGKPTPMPRTKISTLSTYTLKPCRTRFDSCAEPPAAGTITADTTAGQLCRGLLNVPEEEMKNVDQPAGTTLSKVKPCEKDKFTESELKGGSPKKIKSERLRMASPKRLRRALSATDDPFAVITAENAADRSNGGSEFRDVLSDHLRRVVRHQRLVLGVQLRVARRVLRDLVR